MTDYYDYDYIVAPDSDTVQYGYWYCKTFSTLTEARKYARAIGERVYRVYFDRHTGDFVSFKEM